MDIANASKFARVNDYNSEPSSPGDSTTIDVDDHSRKSETFLEEQGGSIHPIFDTRNDQSRTKPWKSTELGRNGLTESTQEHTEQFLEAMKKYQASMKDKKWKELNLEGKHCWKDVIQAANQAEAVYLEAGRKIPRKVSRFITANAEAAVPFLYLIPNDWYCCILFGGLKLVFEALSHVSEKRDRILKTLLRIPDVIDQAEHCVKNFPSDQALYDKATDLYVAILTAIEGTTKWLTRNPALKQVQALVLGPVYNKSFKDKILALDEALGALNDRVSNLRDGAIVTTQSRVESVDTVLHSVGKTGEATLVQVNIVQSEVKGLQESADRTEVKIDHLSDLQQAKEEANRAMKIVLNETVKSAQWREKHDRVIRRLKKQIEHLERAATCLTPHDLLDILGVDADLPTQDLRRISRSSQSTDLSAFHIITSVSKGAQYQDWLTTDTSAALFIESSSPSQSHSRTTPLSLLSAAVITSLDDADPALPVHFFCGSHTSPQDPLRGPQGMLRSLIAQILHAFPTVDLSFIGSRRSRDQLETLSPHALSDCLAKLVKRLPMDTVLVCVVDGISSFRRKEWADDTRRAMDHLLDLTDDDGQGAVFKLLVTSPARRSPHAGDAFHFPPQCRLVVPAPDEGGNNARHVPTEREVSMRSARQIGIGAGRGNVESLHAQPPRAAVDVGADVLWDVSSDSSDLPSDSDVGV